MQYTNDFARATLGLGAALLIATPNISWLLYLPALILWLFCIFLVRPRHDLVIMGSMYVGFFCVPMYLIDPSTLPYNALFFTCLLFAIETFGPKADDFVHEGMIRSAPYVLFGATLLPMFLPFGSILQSRPEGVQLIGEILRQRGFYSEPGFLGHWAALFLWLNLLRGRSCQVFVSAVVLVLSASAGAMSFLFLLLAVAGTRLSSRQLAFSLLLIAALLFAFYDQILLKIMSGSMLHRLGNFVQTFDFLMSHSFLPMGFGPIHTSVGAIGVLSFVLVLLKAFGFFVLPLIAWLFLKIGIGIRLLALLMPWFLLGNYWETPVLALPLLFMRGLKPFGRRIEKV